MQLKVLGSGSSGNCYILENENEALIIEAGVSFKEIKKALGFNIHKIVGVVVSHSHLDHSKFLGEYEKAGVSALKMYLHDYDVKKMKYFAVRMEGFKIKPFPLIHDVPCFGFLIEHEDIGRLLFISDTKYAKYHFSRINHILVEANYDKTMLSPEGEASIKRNHVLTGHMEIGTTCDFIQANKTAVLRNVVLLHLSNHNSDAEQFKDKARKVVENSVSVYVASKGLEVDLNLCPF